MKLFGNSEKQTSKDKIDKNVLYLEIIEAVLVHYNTVNNGYQHDLRVLYIFISDKSFR